MRSEYHNGYEDGVAWVKAEIAKRERPRRWVETELSTIRTSLYPASDYGAGRYDGRAVTLANWLTSNGFEIRSGLR
jgi:hypothetical protein